GRVLVGVGRVPAVGEAGGLEGARAGGGAGDVVGDAVALADGPAGLLETLPGELVGGRPVALAVLDLALVAGEAGLEGFDALEVLDAAPVVGEDAVPIGKVERVQPCDVLVEQEADGLAHEPPPEAFDGAGDERGALRSEEHTSELQSREKLVCRLLLEKK